MNRAASLGDSPCAPAASPNYFYAAPALDDTTPLTLGTRNVTAATVHIPIGASATIPVELVSNFAVGPIEVQAFDASPYTGEPPHLALSLDRSSGMPGDTLQLTIQKIERRSGQFRRAPLRRVRSGRGPDHVLLGHDRRLMDGADDCATAARAVHFAARFALGGSSKPRMWGADAAWHTLRTARLRMDSE